MTAPARPELAALAPLLEQLATALAPHLARAVLPLLVSSDVDGELCDQRSPEVRAMGVRAYIAAIRSGALPGRRVGRRWLARRADVVAFAAGEARTQGARKLCAEGALKLGGEAEPDPADALALELGLRRVG